MPLRQKLFVIAVVYVVEGFPMGVFSGLLPAFLRELDVSLAAIGAVAGLRITWSLKVLWSPLIDRYGERRDWIAGALLAMALALLALADFEASELAPALWLALVVYCTASATQDVAIDAYTIGIVDPGEEGPANAMRNTAYRIGMVGLANALLFAPRWIGWGGALTAASVVSLAMALAVRLMPRVEVPAAARREMLPALKRWLSQPDVVPVFAFVLLYRVGDIAMSPMVTPFWLDRGLTREELGAISGFAGGVATIAGAWVAAGVLARIGIPRSLLAMGVVALASNLGYAAAAALPEVGRVVVYAASLTESFCGGAAGVAFMSFLMRICQKEHAAVQYALLTAIYNLAGSLLVFPSGVLTEQLGYAVYFALTAVFALPAFALLPAAARWSRE